MLGGAHDPSGHDAQQYVQGEGGHSCGFVAEKGPTGPHGQLQQAVGQFQLPLPSGRASQEFELPEGIVPLDDENELFPSSCRRVKAMRVPSRWKDEIRQEDFRGCGDACRAG